MKMIRLEFIIILLIIYSTVSFSQEPLSRIDEEAQNHVFRIDSVAHFTKEQKSTTQNIFKQYILERKELDPKDFISPRDYRREQIKLYVEARRNVYSICTEEQLEELDKYLSERAEARKRKKYNQ